MPGPMSRPDGKHETDAEKKYRGQLIMEGHYDKINTGKTAAARKKAGRE